MNSTTRLNLMLFVGVFLLIGVNGALFSYSYWGPALVMRWNDYWNEKMPTPAKKAGDRTISDCLKVSDYYSVHLTTYFLADSADSAGGRTDDMSKYEEYCDRVPGTGKVIFSATLMEKDARKERVGLSFYQLDDKGERKELTTLPSAPHNAGFVTMEATVAHKGKYLLKLAFGEGKEKEDIIEMPIFVGR